MSDLALAPTRSRSQTSSAVWTRQEDERLIALMANKRAITSWSRLVPAFPGKTAQQIGGRWENVLNPDVVKGSWTREEDAAILAFVAQHGPGNWATLAAQLPRRIGKQCRERWTNHLCPHVVKGQWTAEEERRVVELHQQFGNQWAKIASFLPGRTDHCVKNRWNSTLKRRLERMASGEPLVRKRGRKPKAPCASSDAESECAQRIELPPISAIGVAIGFGFPVPPGPAAGHSLDVQSLMNR
jgi:hypothetical protein